MDEPTGALNSRFAVRKCDKNKTTASCLKVAFEMRRMHFAEWIAFHHGRRRFENVELEPFTSFPDGHDLRHGSR